MFEFSLTNCDLKEQSMPLGGNPLIKELIIMLNSNNHFLNSINEDYEYR